MVNFLDDQLKVLTDALKARGMWDNTLMILRSVCTHDIACACVRVCACGVCVACV
jgi:hypothetical protein